MKKIKNRRGETLIESLVSILIVALVFAFFATAAVTAGRINAKTRNTDVSFHYDESAAPQDGVVKLTGRSGTVSQSSIALYENNGYYYYAEVSAP